MNLISESYRDKVHVHQIIRVIPKIYTNITFTFSKNILTPMIKPRYVPVTIARKSVPAFVLTSTCVLTQQCHAVYALSVFDGRTSGHLGT